ncbi:MAG: DNA polymerase III subunit beta [Rickettsiales bacterium]|nr:DNA polymerase III subunit beta [Rickettsiales bacterium]
MLNENFGLGINQNSDTKQCVLEIDKKTLVLALSHVQSVVERRNIIPILSNVLITVKNNQVTLSTTDMDILISEVISTPTSQEFSTTLSAHLLYDIVRKLDERHKIKFNLTNNNVNISCGNSSFNLPTLPADEFPKFGDIKYTSKFKISSIELKKMIDECKFAMADEEIRYNLSGIYIHYYDSSIRLVATDGHRLSISSSNKITDLKEFQGIIIPKKTILELRKIIDELTEDIELHISTNKILCSGKCFTLLSKLIDAKFPDYGGLIPQDNNIKIEVKADLFSNVVDRVATITNEKFRGIKFILNKNSLLITANDDIGNKAEEILDVNTDYTGNLELGFNFKYILDVMNVIKGDKVICSFKDPFSPTIIENPSNKNFKYIVMPRRV